VSTWRELEARYMMNTYARQPVVLVKGQGCRVWDEDGTAYLDLVAGIAVNSLGHAHPALAQAVADQARILIHTSNLYYTVPQVQLAQLLVESSCADKVFFCNSGAEANEGAIKLARKYGKLHKDGAYEVLSAEHSFHGRTLATVAATGQPKYQLPFAPMPDGFKQVPYNDLEALKKATTQKTIAVLLEPVQGESGVHLADRDYINGVKEWCQDNGLLLIFDEVQSGLGRTGKLFAYQHYDVEPDVFTLAKGTAGGLPVGVLLAKEKAAVFTPGDHASTFGGTPLVCAVALAAVRTILEQGLVENAARVGTYFLEALDELKKRHPVITATRGLGLMLAFDLDRDRAKPLVARALENGLLINATGERTVRLVPPLIITSSEIDEAIQILDRSLSAIGQCDEAQPGP
jgi:predicted acetylornithine/succinylornithine family transaminase